jgi:fructose-specific phosphotransferase system component IIB
MADSKNSGNAAAKAAAFSRIKHEQTSWGDIYTGRIADLIEAGLINTGQVPGRPGMPKVAATFYRGAMVAKHTKAPATDEHYVSVTLRGRHGAQVRIGISEVEETRREAERQRSRDREIVRRETARAAAKTLALMPKSHDEFRAKTVEKADVFLFCLDSELKPRQFHGYTYDAAVVETINELKDEILDVLRTGTTRLDRARHDAIVAASRAEVARGDDRFLAMLETVQAVDVGVLDEVAHG